MNPGCAADRRSEAKHVRLQPNELSEAGGSPFPGERGEGADREFEAPVDGGMRRAERAAPAASGLPCQNSNNSNRPPKKYRLKPIPNAPGWFIDPNVRDAVWKQQNGDLLQRWGRSTGAEAKAAFNLRLNVAAFVEHWGRIHCLFFTVTDEDNLHPTLFARRWNSYLVRNGVWIVSFIRVLEPQKQDRPHYHLLVAVVWDTRADSFDWEAFDECQRERSANGPTPRFRELRTRYKASAAPELVALWSLLRKVLPRYGLGRAELLPLRKGKGGNFRVRRQISRGWSDALAVIRGKDAEGSNSTGVQRSAGYGVRESSRGIRPVPKPGVCALASWGPCSVLPIWTESDRSSARSGLIGSATSSPWGMKRTGVSCLILSVRNMAARPKQHLLDSKSSVLVAGS